MCRPTTVDLTSVTAKHRIGGNGIRSKTLVSALATTMFGLVAASWPSSARAVDGCLVLLCFAAPSWRSIPQCVPPIREVLRDLARGRAFPTCGMSGPGNSASHQWASAPGFCPPQYTRVFDGPSGPVFTCDYSGAVTVTVEGAVWGRTWWGFAGDTATEFTPAAKAQLGTWDNKFDTDYASWLASLPPPPPPCPMC
jgi:hypothetical protein